MIIYDLHIVYLAIVTAVNVIENYNILIDYLVIKQQNIHKKVHYHDTP